MELFGILILVWFELNKLFFILNAHSHEVFLDGLLEPPLVFFRLNDGWLVAPPELLEARLQHFLESVVLNVVNNTKPQLLGPRIDDD